MSFIDTVSGGMQGVMKSGASKEAIAQTGSNVLGSLGMVIFFVVIFLAIVMFIYFFIIKNNIKVEIYKEYNGKIYSKRSDFGREIRKDGQRLLKLFKANKETPMPEGEFRLKQGSKDLYIFKEDNNGQFHPMLPDLNSQTIKYTPQERTYWLVQDAESQALKHKKNDDLWNKFQAIQPTVIMIIVFLIIFFMTKHIGGNLDSLAGSFAQVSQNCLGN